MARREFVQDVRRAVSFMAPRVEADSPFTDPTYIEEMLRRSDLWLTQGVVESFQSGDFSDLDDGAREGLIRAVNDFLAVARSVPPNGLVLPDQRDAASKPFMHIVQTVQNIVRTEWMAASRELLNEAEGWARQAGWPCKRYEMAVTEDFIGSYKQARLVFSAEGAQLALIPVGRFAPATDGMFDLAVMPAYDSVMVVRKNEKWFIHPLPGEEGRQDWSQEAFVSTSLKLTRLP